MSTSMMFASSLTDDPQLLHGRDDKPSVAYRVAVSRHVQNDAGERIDGERFGRCVTACGTAANHLYDTGGRDRVAVHGQLRSERVDDRFDEMDASLKYGVTRLARQIAPAGKTEN
jgi:single-stranded DNA-binding protein